MSLNINPHSDTFSFTGQIEISDLQEIARLGFKTVINNRPDHEGGYEQPTSAELEKAALECGLHYVHLPVIPNQISLAQIQAFSKAFDQAPKPVVGFCKTGKRASTLYNMAAEYDH